MNKLIIFPLLIMMVIVTVSFSTSGILPSDENVEINDNGYWHKTTTIFGQQFGDWHNSNTGTESQASPMNDYQGYFYPPETPNTEFNFFNSDNNQYEHYTNLANFNATHGATTIDSQQTGNLFDSSWFWGILIAALVLAIASGIQIFGSGMSEYSQRNLFVSTMWGAVWAFLTIGSANLLLNDTLGTIGYLIYGGLTLCYILGIVDVAEER
jgi:hypothetical protein